MRTLLFLAEYPGQCRDRVNTLFPRLGLESESDVLGVELNRWKLEKISREHELQVRELLPSNSMEIRTTDLDPTKRFFISSDSAGYVFLIENLSGAGLNGDGMNTHKLVEQDRVDHRYCPCCQKKRLSYKNRTLLSSMMSVLTSLQRS